MNRIRSTCRLPLLTTALIVVGWSSNASADCLRRVYNHSAYVLVGVQDHGPAFVVRPGRSATVRLSRAGRFDLTASCPPADRFGRPIGGGREAARISLDYEAVRDRCFITFGDSFFERDLGPGFFGTQDTAPFAVNNPNPGDIVLGAFNARCAPPN